jgi:hypothetical protein
VQIASQAVRDPETRAAGLPASCRINPARSGVMRINGGCTSSNADVPFG